MSRILKMKDGRTHLGYKAQNTVDLETDIVLAAEVLAGDTGDAETLPDTAILARLKVFELSQLGDVADGLWGLVADGGIEGLADALLGFEARFSEQGRWLGAGVIGVGASYVGYGASVGGAATWSDVGDEFSQVVSAASLIDTLWSVAQIDERIEALADEVRAPAN